MDGDRDRAFRGAGDSLGQAPAQTVLWSRESSGPSTVCCLSVRLSKASVSETEWAGGHASRGDRWCTPEGGTGSFLGAWGRSSAVQHALGLGSSPAEELWGPG